MKIMNELQGDMNIKRRKSIGKAALIFLAVMLLLTFFSNTINNFSLPKVTYETPLSGALIREVSGSGSVEAKTVHDFYLSVGRKVTKVSVQAGDEVKRGQSLMSLETSDIRSQLKDEQDMVEQKKLNLQKLTEATSPANLLKPDREVQAAQQALDKAQREYDNDQSLYEAGAIAANELYDAKTELENAKLDFGIARNNRQKTIADNKKDIENAKLDLQMEERKIAGLIEEIKLADVAAPCDGVVTELNFSEGMTANSSQPLYKIAETTGGFQFTAIVDASAAKCLEAGDAADISLRSAGNRAIQGTVKQVKDNELQPGVKKDIIIDIPSDGISGGENGTADIKKNEGSYDTLVSNSAIGQDNNGHFVYVVRERSGPLGEEYYVQKVTVTTGESDQLKTAVLSGLNAMDHVVNNNDKVLSDGARVLLDDESR